MSGVKSGLAGVGAAVGILVAGVGPAHASGSLQDCLDQGANHAGGLPTCTEVNGKWVASWPGEGGSGIFGAFIVLFVLVVAVGVAVTVWKVKAAQRLAQESGMDPGLATQMTLLTENGLDATYLAATLHERTADGSRPEQQPDLGPFPTGRSAAERLTELGALRDQGLVTQAEYEERRRAIIDGV